MTLEEQKDFLIELKKEIKEEKFLTELIEKIIEKIKESTSKTPPQKMKGIYLEKNNMEFFIGCLDEEKIVKIDGITTISESAFANSDVENILFSGCSSGCYTIGKSTFENCDKLKTVIFGELVEKGGATSILETSILKNVKLDSAVTDNLTIQTNAFKGCSSLTTLILPQINGTLTIEKDAFSGCEKLRAVVAVCGNADFTENPFSGCPAHLTFVCKKDSDNNASDKKNFEVARFARENGYRSVHAD